MSPDDLEPEWRFLYEERAAIREHDGGLPRPDAERLALLETLAARREWRKPFEPAP